MGPKRTKRAKSRLTRGLIELALYEGQHMSLRVSHLSRSEPKHTDQIFWPFFGKIICTHGEITALTENKHKRNLSNALSMILLILI